MTGTMNSAILAAELGNLWAIEPSAVGNLQNLLRNPMSAMTGGSAARSKNYDVTSDGIAQIEVRGLMMKAAGWWSDAGIASATSLVAQQVQDAADDPAVKGIMLVVDSPGGAVAGTADAATAIRAAAEQKPIHAFVEDIAASAAYRLTSQADQITASRGAIVGSIGTYAVIYDLSGLYQQAGVKVNVVRAGDAKGAGVPGTVVTDAQLAEYQRTINAINSEFVADVAAGREISSDAAANLADGRVHVGTAAKSMGLVDAIGTYADAMDGLRASLKGTNATSTARASSTSAGSITATQVTAFAEEVRGGLRLGMTHEAAIGMARENDPMGYESWCRAGQPR